MPSVYCGRHILYKLVKIALICYYYIIILIFVFI